MKFSSTLIKSFFTLVFSTCLLTINSNEVFADSVEISSKWICEIGEGSDYGITQIKKGKQVESSFAKAKKLTRKTLRKLKEKLAIAKKTGKKKPIKRLKKKLRTQKNLIKNINKCKAGELTPSEPDIEYRSIRVLSELSIQIDPSRSWDQYFGQLDFTNVESLSPKDVGVPSDLSGIARAKCLEIWGTEAVSGFAAVRIFTLRIATNQKVNLNVSAFWRPQFFAATEGKWISRGGNAESGAVVIAEAGFWNSSYNRRTISKQTSIDYKGKSVAVDCRIDEEARTFYP